MDALLLVLRLALAAVFTVSAIAKVADFSGTRATVEEFGAPRKLAGPVAGLLPIAELAVVGLVLFPATAVAGAMLALALLAVFSVAIAVNLRRGNRPDCHCFGKIGTEPIGAKTLGRNALIAAVAVLVVGLGWDDAGTSAVAWIGDLSGTELAILVLGVCLTAALVLGGLFALALLRQHGRLLLRVDRLEVALAQAGIEIPGDDVAEPVPQVGLPPGTRAPEFSLAAVDGETVGLQDLLAPELPVLLVFSDPGCGPCDALTPDVSRWQREHAGDVTVAVVAAGDRDDVASKAAEHELERVLLDAERSVSESFEAYGTPAAVMIAPSGAVAASVAQGATAIEALFETARDYVEPTPPGLPVGDAAPRPTLRELGGEEVSIAERLAPDRDTAIVFWNPGCGFCRSMHEELRELEERPANGAPALLVLAAGDEDAVREEGFSAPVFLDPDFSASGEFEANGTPMAVLVGPDGTIRSPLSIGAPQVLGLLGGDSGPGPLRVVRRG